MHVSVLFLRDFFGTNCYGTDIDRGQRFDWCFLLLRQWDHQPLELTCQLKVAINVFACRQTLHWQLTNLQLTVDTWQVWKWNAWPSCQITIDPMSKWFSRWRYAIVSTDINSSKVNALWPARIVWCVVVNDFGARNLSTDHGIQMLPFLTATAFGYPSSRMQYGIIINLHSKCHYIASSEHRD